MKWLVDFTTTIFFCVGSMPRLVNSSSPVAWVRLAISTTSTPPMRTAAQSPTGTCVGPKLCQASRFRPDRPRPRHRSAAPEVGAILPPKRRPIRGAETGVEAEAHGDRIPDRPEAGASRRCCSIRCRRMSVLSDGAPPPALSAGSAITTGRSLKATPSPTPAATSNDTAARLAAQRHQLLAELRRQRIGLLLVAVGDHQHARADLGHVAIGKAVRDRDRQDAVLAFHRHDAVDEAAHRLHRRRIALDLAAVVDRHHRLDLAAQRRQHEVEHVLGALDHVGVRELLVEHDDVGVATRASS